LFGILRSRFPPLARAPHLRRSKNRRFGSELGGFNQWRLWPKCATMKHGQKSSPKAFDVGRKRS